MTKQAEAELGPAMPSRTWSQLSTSILNLNPQSSTLNATSSTLNRQPSTLHSKPQTLNLQPSTLNPRPYPRYNTSYYLESFLSDLEAIETHFVEHEGVCGSTLDPEPSTLNPQPRTPNSKPQTPNPKPQTLHHEPQISN